MVFQEKLRKLELSLSFDDILIKPSRSSVLPKDVDVSLALSEKLTLKVPVFSAAMDTITGYDMARVLIANGCCAPLHKNVTIEENAEILRKLKGEFGSDKPLAVSIGADTTPEQISQLVEAGANVMVVDSAHAHSENVGRLVSHISQTHPDIFLIAGNVVTEDGAKFLFERGAKGIKVGIGPGSICTTRKVTGIGRGQVSSISEVADFNKRHGIITIADGGIRSTDEIMKSIACGADAVMLGFMFSGCEECPGEITEIDGEKYKVYRGMGSMASMKQGSAARYNKDGVSSCKWVPEGVESYVRLRGSAKEVVDSIEWSLRSAFGYLGAPTLKEAQEGSELVRITESVKRRSSHHGLNKVFN